MSWTKMPLSELADFCLGKMLDEKKNKGEPLPYLANVNVRWGGFDLGDLREMRFEQHEMERYGLKHGDIVMCEGGEPGRCALWKDQVPGMMIQKALHRIRPHDSLDNRFLFYFFLHKGKNGGFSPLFTGATIKPFPRQQLAKFEVDYPSLEIQKHVADILSAYDDLIENNRRRIQLLEESARLLYREWFVHMRFPGHEHVKVVDGVPEGWQEGRIDDFYITSSGGTPSRKVLEYYEGEINWVKTQELQNNFIFKSEEKITEEAVKNSSAKIFPVNTILVAMYGATIGQIAILANEAATNQACCALMSKIEHASYIFAYLFLRENKEGLINLSQGAAQNNISQQIIRAFPMLMPHEKIMREFDEYCQPIFLQIRTIQQMQSLLQEARDLLLPRLMNGDIAV